MKTPVRFCLLFLFLIGLISVWSCKEKAAPSPTPTPTTKSSAKDITKFSFAALSPVVDATIDAAAKTIKATVPATTDLTKLVPTITISDKAMVSPASGTAQDFSKEVTYTVTAEDASTQVWKVNVTKVAVVAAGFTTTTKAKMPIIADMGDSRVFFTINSKIYYLGNSKASTRDYKYFLEYDPATDKWTQKADFPFKAMYDGTGFPFTSNFIHKGKAYFSSSYYGFMEYDPTADKWNNLNFGISSFYNNAPYFGGMLFSFNSTRVVTYDFDNRKSTIYDMTGGGDFLLTGVPENTTAFFEVDGKIYMQIFADETTTAKQRFDTYEVDYINRKYIKKASFEGNQRYNTMGNALSGTSNGNSFSKGFFVDGKVYYISQKNILMYDPKTDTFQMVATPSNFNSFIFGTATSIKPVVISKSIYVLDNNNSNAIVIAQIP